MRIEENDVAAFLYNQLGIVSKDVSDMYVLEQAFANVTYLKLFLFSFTTGKYKEALRNLIKLHKHDAYIHQNPNDDFLRKISIAVAWTFTQDHSYFADDSPIDMLVRYDQIKEFRGHFFPSTNDLKPWHWIYVASGWQTSDEWNWVHRNVKQEFKTEEKIHGATHDMISYNSHNKKGVSVHDNDAYYDNKPRTMAVMYEYGGVCGVVSKFGAACCNAFGQPSMPVGQPGHCAFVFFAKNEWDTSNGICDFADSTIHGGCIGPWSHITNKIWTLYAMNKCQLNFECYVQSEIYRFWASRGTNINDNAAYFVRGILLSPFNLQLWSDMAGFDQKPLLLPFMVPHVKLETPLDLRHEPPGLISEGCIVTTTDPSEDDKKQNITDGTGSEWWTKMDEVTVTIDLGQASYVAAIEIQWWGTSVPRSIVITTEKERICDQSAAYETPGDSYNAWTKFSFKRYAEGRKVEFKLRNGSPDPWGRGYYIGIRQISILGWHNVGVYELPHPYIEQAYDIKMTKIVVPDVSYISNISFYVPNATINPSFDERQFTCFGSDCRMRLGRGKMRVAENGMVVYSIKDIVVCNYFFIDGVDLNLNDFRVVQCVGKKYSQNEIITKFATRMFPDQRDAAIRSFVYDNFDCNSADGCYRNPTEPVKVRHDPRAPIPYPDIPHRSGDQSGGKPPNEIDQLKDQVKDGVSRIARKFSGWFK